jgi:hypothetical protein
VLGGIAPRRMEADSPGALLWMYATQRPSGEMSNGVSSGVTPLGRHPMHSPGCGNKGASFEQPATQVEIDASTMPTTREIKHHDVFLRSIVILPKTSLLSTSHALAMIGRLSRQFVRCLGTPHIELDTAEVLPRFYHELGCYGSRG